MKTADFKIPSFITCVVQNQVSSCVENASYTSQGNIWGHERIISGYYWGPGNIRVVF